MKTTGNYFGYDDTYPPWNDTIPHHYVFTLYAFYFDKCLVSGTFKGPGRARGDPRASVGLVTEYEQFRYCKNYHGN